MTTEKRKTSSVSPQAADFNFSDPPPIVPTNPTYLAGSDADLEKWSEERIAIYASLDAAMTRHIVEAISALSELKQRVEDEAYEASQVIILERDRLRHEAEELRLEGLKIQDQIKASRRSQQEEEARQIALEHSSDAWTQQARAERDELQLEVKRLKVQLEEVRADLQAFYRQRAEAVEAGGGFAAWLEKHAAPEGEQYTEPITPPPLPASVVVEHLNADSLGDLPIFSLDDLNEPSIPGELEDFGDAPTPRVPGGSPVQTFPVEPVAQSESATEIIPLPAAPLEPPTITLSDEEEIAQDHAQVIALFNELNDTAQSDENDPIPTPFGSVSGEKTRDRQRRVRTEQRVNHLLNRRRGATDAPTPAAEALPAEPTTTGRSKSRKRPASLAPNSAKAKDEKEALQEIGAQLGLDPMTPPPVSAMQFAPGFTPPPQPVEMSQMLAELKANANALVTNTGPLVRPIRVTPPTTTTVATPNFQSLIEPEEGPRTLEELLQDGAHDLETLDENPTPPENPTPFIGNIGLDYAVRFQAEPLTPPGQTRLDKLEEANGGPSAPAKSGEQTVLPVADPAPRPLSSLPEPPLPVQSIPPKAGLETLSRRRPSGRLGIMPLPPPPMVPSDTDIGETKTTKLIVSNLQGRFSPLVMEKVIRNLEEVIHVIVTEFSKGVLGMDVRHKTDFDLAHKLLSMSELHLKLIEQGPDSLELSQETN